MSGTRFSLAAVAILTLVLTSAAFPPAPVFRGPRPTPPEALPVGRWTVEFANKVVEECEVRKDGTAGVAEPNRIAGGKATAKGGGVVIVFDDDRVERWTAVGQRMVVEHWFPAAQYPAGTPVLGVADRSR